MHAMYVKDADNVWNVLNGQSFIFKNQYLDADMSNYKREMERIEEEGMIYTQADIADYINMDRINGQIKKVYLDALTNIISLITIVATMVIAYATLDSLTSYDHFVAYDIPKTYLFAKSAVEFVRPILIFITFVSIIVFEMTFFYKTSYARLINEYNLFISDFAKQVMPSAKTDAINNVLYLQQLSIQNTKHTIEENLSKVTESFKDVLVRNSESSKEIDRHLEQMASSINGFNANVEDMKLSIMDQTEHNKLASKNMLKSYKDVLDTFEKRMDTMTDGMKESIVSSIEGITISKNLNGAEKATAKKTTSVKRATKKKETEEKIDSEVEVVVKKKRGRKSKAEKEAEEAAKLALLEQVEAIKNAELVQEESAKEDIEEGVKEAKDEVTEDITAEEITEVLEDELVNEEVTE
jgi:hypothetical protein